ncbi:ephrin-A4-like isoform X1 [Prinia subflava]|uniref:ephrin-A4-like isoform X1 n=1 Tax=Prinia subflava TaxID=208062 RepID=UPI002FE33B13
MPEVLVGAGARDAVAGDADPRCPGSVGAGASRNSQYRAGVGLGEVPGSCQGYRSWMLAVSGGAGLGRGCCCRSWCRWMPAVPVGGELPVSVPVPVSMPVPVGAGAARQGLMAVGEVAGRRRGGIGPKLSGRAGPCRAPPGRPARGPPPPPAAGGAMRPAPLLGLLLWAPLLWAPPVRGFRHGVHWNGSNPRFLRDDYSIQVAINDYLDIYCPHYEGAVPAGRAETFTLFMVDREGYRGCYETPGAFKRWECNRPRAPFGPVRFSEKIQRFTPFSLGFEFQPGETYYYISVPSPESAGRCLKLRVTVCCRGTTPEPVTEVPNSQPRGRGGPEDVVPARGTAVPSQPCSPCLALLLLALLWI